MNNGRVSLKMNDKQDGLSFEIVNFPFLDGDVLASLLLVYKFRSLIVFSKVCSNVIDFNNRNQFLTSKLLKQGFTLIKSSS